LILNNLYVTNCQLIPLVSSTEHAIAENIMALIQNFYQNLVFAVANLVAESYEVTIYFYFVH
jgi:hypothetical protein